MKTQAADAETNRSRTRRYASRLGWLLLVVALTLLAVRIYDSQRGPPLELWHTYVPAELDADELEAADWPRYLEAEDAAFAGRFYRALAVFLATRLRRTTGLLGYAGRQPLDEDAEAEGELDPFVFLISN